MPLDAAIPPDCPIRPLGHHDGTFYVLSASGELRAVSSAKLERGNGLQDLFVGAVDGLAWLAREFPPKRANRPVGSWNREDAGTWLMRACTAVGFFDPDTPVRSYGTWRGEGGAAIAHCGTRLYHTAALPDPAGCEIAGAIYPAGPVRGVPADEPADFDEIAAIRDSVAAMWGWRRPADADIWLGWIGMAALGAFPTWRSHLWVSGRRGSGKSELIEVADLLLGPMSPNVLNNYSEAGVRQGANNQARAFLFDEAERDAHEGRVEAVIGLLRHMSGGDGSRVTRGSSDHKAVNFSLVGAGYLSSILPGRLEPQDRSRFVMLELGQIPQPPDSAGSAEAGARRLAELRDEARFQGPRLWRRMLDQALRWDGAFNTYSALVQRMGGEHRDGATIGALLAGRDLLLFDDPPDDERLAAAREIAAPLVDDARAASEEGEGEMCWRHLLGGTVFATGGVMKSLAEVIVDTIGDTYDNTKLLGRYGMRWDPARDVLYLVSSPHPQLDRIFSGKRWGQGGHRQALLMLDGVQPADRTIRIGGSKVRALEVSRDLLPKYD